MNVLLPKHNDKALTDPVSKPLFSHVIRVPYVFGEVGRALIDVDELDKLRVQVRVSEGAIRHQAVVEVLGVHWVALQGVKLRELRLQHSLSIRKSRRR